MGPQQPTGKPSNYGMQPGEQPMGGNMSHQNVQQVLMGAFNQMGNTNGPMPPTRTSFQQDEYAPPSPPYIYGVDQEAMLEGEKLNLSCEAHGGHSLANLTWYRGVEKVCFLQNFISGKFNIYANSS